ncbi:hypothetical protein IWW39_001877 [Coemansia spiralis]|uniref:Uncharacterized protein n=1 Tax=Coemansia spiralis TaxID=417178 RepID=A0A9W8L446_9FUNG|nr:hypothetical protein IWW39_001877 [Coemansia spiralis]
MSNRLSTAQQLPNNVLRTIIKKIINEKRLQLTINEKAGSIRLSRPNWVENEELPHDAAHLVREFRVNMSISSVAGGSSLGLLTEYLGDCRFPIANKLYVTINGYHTEARESREVAIANINAFSLFLRSLVPADVAVKLACVSEDEFMAINESTVGVMYEEYFEVFAGSLYAGAREAMLDLNDVKLSRLSTIDAIPMVSRLELDCLLSPKTHTALVVLSR